MLVAVLNTCTKEELEETDDDMLFMPIVTPEEHAERRKIIKSKLLAVGRMARVFALLRSVVSTFKMLCADLFVRQRGI
jgi:serine/threonine-protein phosphatase 2B catalytic subunit